MAVIKSELIDAQIENVGALPAAGKKGRLVYLTTDSLIYRDNGAAFKAISPGVPTNTVQSVVAAAADGTIVDQDFYISPQYTLTVTGAPLGGYSGIRSIGHFYRLGTVWRLNFNITFDCDVTSSSYITISNVIFKTSGTFKQAISVSSSTGGCYGTTKPNTGEIYFDGNSASHWYLSGDVELNAKPTAYLPAGV